MRFLTVFAFMQTMHYVVWVALFPRVAPDASAAFEARVPWVTGPRLWAVGFVAAALFAVLFGLDFAQGRTVYAALASYHAYLELPVLLALLVGARSLSAASPSADRPGGAGPTTRSAPPPLAPQRPLPPAGGGSRGADLRPEATAAVAPDTEVGP
jgi:hypothetical protein